MHKHKTRESLQTFAFFPFHLHRPDRYSFRTAVTMPLRRRARCKASPHDPTDDNARLLPAIELQDYRSDASPSIYDFSELDASSLEGVDINSYESPPRKQLQRVATLLRLGRCVDALKRCAKQHLGGQLVIERVWEGRVQVESSPETSSGEWEKKGHSWGDSKLKSDSDDNLRSTIKWYLWSPSDTMKNCPTLEFVRPRLAPPNVWL